MNSANRETTTPLRRPMLGLLAGLLGGTIVGIAESLVVLSGGADLPELGIFPYAVVSYGILSALMGLGLGIAGLIVSKVLGIERSPARVFSFYLTVVMLLEGIVIGRFRIVRDVFHEKHPGPVLDLGLLAGAVVLFFILHRLIFTPLIARRPLRALTGAKVAVPVYLIILIISLIVRAGAGELGVVPPSEQSEETLARLADRPNVILVIVDTMRADRLSCYGYEKETSPNIDRLAADGILFEKGFAQASWTRPAIATLFTSLYPSSHRAIGKADLLPDEVVTLAEAFKREGYYTIGFADNVNISPSFNFDQGFDEYHYLSPDHFFFAPESATQLTVYNQLRLIRERFLSKKTWVQFYYQDAEVVSDLTIDWLEENRDSRYYLMVHYMDPHDPYFPHPYTGEGYARVSMPNPPPELAPKLSDIYDGEIRFFDTEFGRLLDWLESNGLYDETVILLTADHGEEFYEHGGWWHGTTLYDEQVHIPFILKPAVPLDSMRISTELVRHLDIPPTLLALAGADIPPTMQGAAILDSTGAVGLDVDFVFSEEDLEGNVLEAVRDSVHKLILANENNPRGLEPTELYNIREDPAEMNNLAGEREEVEASLHTLIEKTESYALDHSVEGQEGEIDEATQERLKALGYVEE